MIFEFDEIEQSGEPFLLLGFCLGVLEVEPPECYVMRDALDARQRGEGLRIADARVEAAAWLAAKRYLTPIPSAEPGLFFRLTDADWNNLLADGRAADKARSAAT